jgi:hypothetical protein
MQFSNILITASIIAPLRYYFEKYGRAQNLYWDEDEKKRTLEIADLYDLNKVPFGQCPRILVDRGAYGLSKVGLDDNLAEAMPFSATQGLKDRVNMLFYQGTASLLIEARNKGTCELLADMASHFIAWSRPTLCNSQGWKEFGLPMSVSACTPVTGEDADNTKFQITIQIPWIKEEQWRVQDDGPGLKAALEA